METTKYSLNREDLNKIVKSFLFAFSGAGVAFLVGLSVKLDTPEHMIEYLKNGVHYMVFASALVSNMIYILKKFLEGK